MCAYAWVCVGHVCTYVGVGACVCICACERLVTYRTDPLLRVCMAEGVYAHVLCLCVGRHINNITKIIHSLEEISKAIKSNIKEMSQ